MSKQRLQNYQHYDAGGLNNLIFYPRKIGTGMIMFLSGHLLGKSNYPDRAFKLKDTQVKIVEKNKKRVEKRNLGTTDLLASTLCLGRSWNRSS